MKYGANTALPYERLFLLIYNRGHKIKYIKIGKMLWTKKLILKKNGNKKLRFCGSFMKCRYN